MRIVRSVEELLTEDDIVAIKDLYKGAIFLALNHKKDSECLFYLDLMWETVKEARTYTRYIEYV